jgi:hypothetical protein
MKASHATFFASLCLTLAACGNHDTGTQVAKAAAATPPPTKPSFAPCFTLEPGQTYSMSHGTEVSIANGTFNGKPAVVISSESDGVRTAEYHEPHGRDGLIGNETFGAAALGEDPGKPTETTTFSRPREFPADAQPGSTFSMVAPKTIQVNHSNGESTEHAQETGTLTFVGFESLEVEGTDNKIPNACHIQMKDGDQVNDTWYAAGLGTVQISLKQGETLILSEGMTSMPKKND